MRVVRKQLLALAQMLAIGWAVDVCAQGFSTAQPIDLTLGTYIGSTSAASYGDVALATDGTGLWIATWVVDELSAPSDDLVVARSTDGGLTWLAPQSVKAVDGGHDTHPTVVYDGAGTFLLAWSSSDKLGGPVAGGDDDILLTRSIDGGMTWVTPVALAPNAATDVEEDDAPQLATDGSGNWVAVWQGFSDVLMSRSTDGGVMWSAPVSIGSFDASEPRQVVQVATNGTGTWLATWSTPSPSSGYVVAYSRSTDAGAIWSPSATIDAGLKGYPSVAADGSTWLIAASGPTIRRSIDDGLTWTAPVTLSIGFDPHIASDGAGTSIVVFTSNDYFTQDIDITSMRSDDAGATWSMPVLADTRALKDYPDRDVLPRIAFGGGEWLLSWQSEHEVMEGSLSAIAHPWRARLLPDVRCPAAPLGGCRLPIAPAAATISLRDQANDASDVLSWKWTRGAATSIGDFGDPTLTESYVLCGYDTSSTLVLEARTRGGVCGRSLCWKASGTTGWKLKDAERLPEGISNGMLRSGASGVASIKLKGKGSALPDPSLPLALPLRVQFQASNGECWEAVYSTSQRNDAGTFQARSD